MEVHPILGRDDTPQPDLWYVISSFGQYPSMRVGHTITYVAGTDGKSDKLVIVGGANPSGPFAETHILYLDKYEWDELECAGLVGRYEHCAFVPESQPGHVYIFGGADQTKNLNDVQMLDLATEKWSSPNVSGTPPSPRTCRNSVCVGDKLYVFGGGSEKSEPVADRGVHVFDAATLTWSQPDVHGKVPKSRLGHVMVAVGNKIYLHGGMARDIFYNDLHELNTDTMTLKLVRCRGDVPEGCTAHAAVAISDTQFCIQGGMTSTGALDTTYVFDTACNKWQKMKFECPPPACRLDHAICLGYTTSYVKKESPAHETVSCEKDGDDKGTGDCANNEEGKEETQRTCEESATIPDTESKNTTGHSRAEGATLSEDISVDRDETEGLSNCDNISHESDQTVTNTDSNDENEKVEKDADLSSTTAETSVTSTEGSKYDSASNKAVPHQEVSSEKGIQSLTSLLSIEGTRRVLSSRSGESENTGERVRCLVCVIHGGMDTGGEIFDDCLVWRVDTML